MCSPDDPETVVAPDLKLGGLEGLRIADASIMPIVPSATTYAAAIMIGKKTADLGGTLNVAAMKWERWRPGPESNRCTRICNPLHNHSATWPPR